MQMQRMFQKDINRDINGVVKVAQNDEHSLQQELGEYIITQELRRHFNVFFENYSKSIDQPTDKIGVWISGFFGSGFLASTFFDSGFFGSGASDLRL